MRRVLSFLIKINLYPLDEADARIHEFDAFIEDYCDDHVLTLENCAENVFLFANSIGLYNDAVDVEPSDPMFQSYGTVEDVTINDWEIDKYTQKHDPALQYQLYKLGLHIMRQMETFMLRCKLYDEQVLELKRLQEALSTGAGQLHNYVIKYSPLITNKQNGFLYGKIE